MSRSVFAPAFGVVGALALAGSALAAPTSIVYDEGAFLAANTVVVSQRFDTPMVFPEDQHTVVFDDIRFTSTDTASPHWVVGDGELYREFGEGPDVHADVLIDLEGGGWVAALGLRLLPFGYPNRFEITVTTVDGTTTTTLLPANLTDSYVGISDPDGIISVLVSQRPDLADGVLTNFSLDDVSRSEVLTAPPIVTPSSKRDCKGDGWTTVTRADVSPFKNQGDCVQYVLTGR